MGHLKPALTLSVLAALVELVIFVTLNNLMPIGPDYLVLLLYITIPYFAIIIVLYLLIRIIHARFIPRSSRRFRFPVGTKVFIPVIGYILLLNIAWGFVRNYSYKRLPAEYRTVLIITGVISVLLLVVVWLSYRNFDSLRSAFLRLRLGHVGCIVLSGIVVFLALFLVSHRNGDALSHYEQSGQYLEIHPMYQAERPRILLLGLDGLDIESVERLSNEGRLPNLRKLLKKGCSGHLETVEPTLSPILWTSIASGKVESKHGIHDFRFVVFPGVRPFNHTLRRVKFGSLLTNYSFRSGLFKSFYTYRYYTSTMRTCKNLWNILSDCGLRVGVVGWYVTWPAEQVNGFISSGRSFLYSEEPGPKDSGLTYPEYLFSELKHYNVEFSSLPIDSLNWLCNSPGDGDKRLKEGCMSALLEYLTTIRKNYARDLTVLRVSERMMETDDSWDVMMLYFRSTDSINHLVQKYIIDHDRDVNDSLYIMSDNYCEFIDACVGRIMDRLDENTIMIIMSDHGWDRITGHPFAPPGMILFSGKHIKKGFRLEGMNIYDIAPTVLYMMSLPVALDMDGNPVLACFEDSFVEEHQVRSIPTYEGDQIKKTSLPGNTEIENEMTEQLKILGYID